jgi:tetratricopeptide (TPR) repeat protein
MQAACLALALSLAASAGVAAAASPASGRSLAELAEVYRTVDRERAVAALALWDRERVEAETRQLVDDTVWRGGAIEATRLAAVALLTESALLDLQVGASPRARWELESAARLIRAGPPGTAFGRCFYLLAGIALHSGVELQTAYRLLEEALGFHKDDPELLTAIGAITETVAALRQYDRSPDAGPRGTLIGGYAAEDGSSGSLPSATLADAAGRFERALAHDPELAEARLRLGRVRLLRGQPEAAIADLARVGSQAARPAQRHLARLFEGRAREALGDLAGAVEAYRAATEQAPRAQTGLIALGWALDHIGELPEAQRALERASRADSPHDPWWSYQAGQPDRLRELLGELLRLLP